MNSRKILIPSLILLAGLAASAWLYQGSPAHGEHGHGDEAAEAPEAKGPHRGRLLADGDFTLELAIFEAGVPPEFRAWFTKAGKPVPPADVKLSVTLIRPGKVEDRFAFAPAGDFARGDHGVVEPHSFDYVIVAEHAGVPHKWSFAAPEMQTVIAAAAAEQAGVKVEQAAAAELEETLEVYGRVALDLDGVRRASARFAGVVVETRKSLGDKVAAGEVVASVAPLVSAETQSAVARVVVPNPDGRWRPGGFVKGAVTLAAARAPVTVKASALQSMFDFTVVFSRHGDLYQARPLELGRRSGDRVEVLKGLAAGETYVSEGSFLIKADIGKSAAAHDH